MLWPNGWDFLLIVLATWRVAVFLIRERGPWDIAIRLRECAGIRHDEDGDPISYPDTMPGSALSCVWCTSMWMSALMVGLWVSGYGVIIVLTFGVAGAAVLVELVAGRLTNG